MLLTGDRKRAIEMGFRFASVRGLRPQRNFAGNAIDLRLSGDLPAARWRFDFVQVTQLRVYRALGRRAAKGWSRAESVLVESTP